MFVMALLGILSAIALPHVTAGLDRSRVYAAARYVAHQCALARFEAVGRSRTVAIRVQPRQDDYEMQMFVDGNRNGVRSRDIAAGVDSPLTIPVRIGHLFPGVRFAALPGVIGGDPVRLSGTELLSFTPVGTATAGSLYVLGRDDTQMVVRVLGATARTRVLRWVPAEKRWVTP